MKRGWGLVLTGMMGCFCLGLSLEIAAWGQDDDEAPLIKAGVSESKYLPPAMYGTWNITATVLHTTAPPHIFVPRNVEIWSLEQVGEDVLLRNVGNGAQTKVNVDQVLGETATFHHTAHNDNRSIEILETPTVTVAGDRLYGVNRQIVRYFRRGKPVGQYTCDIQVEGSRLSGGQIRFGNPAAVPDIDIAPIQFR